MAVFASLVGGVAGYGTGALMPLVLVPIVGAEPVVPIIAVSALFTNVSRATAFLQFVDLRRAFIVMAAAVPTCALGAWGYSMLTGRGASIVIGSMMMSSVPLRRILKNRGFRLDDRGLALASCGWGVIVGGTSGAGVILLAILMASGLEGAAVIATDAVVSVVMGIIKTAVFGVAGVMGAKVIAVAVLIGLAAFPGAFFAKVVVERMPLRVHTAILDVVVIVGGVVMAIGAVRH
ncbi:MAG TPA: sulfite exporter TauE/SafE family protein [Xanthobacteraceae bacterium]|nr:sulfite exporter TauE/SafE family protein [Xanthobacteraceae bacterium]